jgi:DNA-binding HxlR family transcriptional regulator
MAVPLPGRSVRGSSSGRPIMALLDLLGRRWTLRIGWELRDRTLSFRELRAACDGMSPSVLNRRLAELREAGVVELTDEGYRLTPEGDELLELIAPVSAWAKRWARRTAGRTVGQAAADRLGTS